MSRLETFNESRHKGRVKFFNSRKGYGFILPEGKEGEEAEEVFVHHTAIHNNGGFKSLAEGEEVEYDIVQGPKGMQASHVTGIGGGFVQGDPRTHHQPQYPTSSGNYRNHNNDNRGGPYNNGGYVFDPYGGGNYGYAMPGYQYMNIQQPMYAQQYGHPPIFPQYGMGYIPQNNNSKNIGESTTRSQQPYYPPNDYSQQQPQPQQQRTIPMSSSSSSLDNHENTTQ